MNGEKDIDEIVEEIEEEKTEGIQSKESDDFEFELFMSTDGKHTVHVKATTKEGKHAALRKAIETYDYIVARFGTKQALAVKEYGNGKKEVDQETCTHDLTKFVQAKTEKNAGRWFKSCQKCNKFLGWQS